MLLCTALGLFAAGGCAQPEPPRSTQIPIDSDPLQGGVNSGDLLTVAKQMAPAILALPEITKSAEKPVRIKIADMKNSSRFYIDRNLFIKRLTIELNRYGRNNVRFLNNNEKADKARTAVLQDRQSAVIRQNLQQIAAEIAS